MTKIKKHIWWIIIIIGYCIYHYKTGPHFGGWIDMIINSKQHKHCGNIARKISDKEWKQYDVYMDCRTEIWLDKKMEADVKSFIEKLKKEDALKKFAR